MPAPQHFYNPVLWASGRQLCHIAILQQYSIETVPCRLFIHAGAFPAEVSASLKLALSAAPGRQIMCHCRRLAQPPTGSSSSVCAMLQGS